MKFLAIITLLALICAGSSRKTKKGEVDLDCSFGQYKKKMGEPENHIAYNVLMGPITKTIRMPKNARHVPQEQREEMGLRPELTVNHVIRDFSKIKSGQFHVLHALSEHFLL